MSDLDPIQRSSQRQFDQQSQRYSQGHILADTADVAALVKRVPPLAGRRALDVAAGAGHTGLFLAAQGWQVTLADISSAMLERATEAASARGLSVFTRQHPAESLPYPDGSFDLVTCRVAAHHFSDVGAFVRESARVLVGGGSLAVIDGTVEDEQPEADSWIHSIEKLRDPSHHRFVNPRSWREHCQAAGLRVEYLALQPFLQPDLNWYFETAGTSAENRQAVLKLIESAPQSARDLFRLQTIDGKITWQWQRMSLLAIKPLA